jgi:hypothetical protein
MRRARNQHLIGERVRLIYCSDPYTLLKAGEEGTVDFVDDWGTVFVQWDSGSNLGMVEEAGDRFEVIGQV